jgi:hypothetical protein
LFLFKAAVLQRKLHNVPRAVAKINFSSGESANVFPWQLILQWEIMNISIHDFPFRSCCTSAEFLTQIWCKLDKLSIAPLLQLQYGWHASHLETLPDDVVQIGGDCMKQLRLHGMTHSLISVSTRGLCSVWEFVVSCAIKSL